MEEKLGVLQETRRSLDDVRAQRREKLRQQELEQDMLRRMQMEQKMELLRQQKQEYMLYQQRLQTQRQQALEQIPKGKEEFWTHCACTAHVYSQHVCMVLWSSLLSSKLGGLGSSPGRTTTQGTMMMYQVAL